MNKPVLDLGSEKFLINDDMAPGVWADVIVEGFTHNGVIRLALGQIIQVGEDKEIAVACRLRMSLATASDVSRLLADAVNAAVGPRGPQN